MSIYETLQPLLFLIPPEFSHKLAIKAVRMGLMVPENPVQNPMLAQQLFGQTFPNPLGLAPGFDKNGECVHQLPSLGFGFFEIGTITRYPQLGNPTPRLFRLTKDKALINRMGFNNEGIETALKHMKALGRDGSHTIPIGMNIGINKNTLTPVEDYCYLLKRASSYADYITINISSPNTKSLRELQQSDKLEELLKALMRTRQQSRNKEATLPPMPLLVKLAPDLSNAELEAIAEVVLAQKVDGVIISNTTINHRDALQSRSRAEAGGLSGAPLFVPSTITLAKFHCLTKGKVPLIGVGGIDSGATLYQKMQAGANLCQLYTALVYHGPAVIQHILHEFLELLAADGVTDLSQIIGINASLWANNSD
jgi:dihydroorotate dehydrogenase